MAEWLYEAGIGEARAALVADGRIVKARIEIADSALRVGTVAAARIIEVIAPGQAIVALDGGGEALLQRIPARAGQGSRLTIAITREAIPEPGRAKLARAVASDTAPAPGPDMRARIAASGYPVHVLRPHDPDALEAAGWSEVLGEALTGEIAFPGGTLRLSPTPAMALFDVDGTGPLAGLAVAAAVAVAEAVVLHSIGGSIGVDFPSVTGKAARAAVAAAIDATLPPPFERTALNGFGFLQIVRPRPRASLPELLRADPVAAAARAALRHIERTPAGAPNTHRLPPAVHARIAANPDWLAALVQRTGRVPIFDA